jgi:hypothetical protein
VTTVGRVWLALTVAQNTLREVAQVPMRTSRPAWNWAVVRVRLWVLAEATKLYQTSVAVVPTPQLVVGGSDCEAAAIVPVTGLVQAVVTGTAMAPTHSSFTGGVGPGLMQSVNVELVGVGWMLPLG